MGRKRATTCRCVGLKIRMARRKLCWAWCSARKPSSSERRVSMPWNWVSKRWPGWSALTPQQRSYRLEKVVPRCTQQLDPFEPRQGSSIKSSEPVRGGGDRGKATRTPKQAAAIRGEFLDKETASIGSTGFCQLCIWEHVCCGRQSFSVGDGIPTM
ncbi:conserved hypothetical protein [Agrobacterium fabacearum S56]|nr:conserved hypothetical protein [Agrobacterium fabacearum S56]